MGSVPLCSDIKGMELPLPIYWYHSKGNWLRYNHATDSFYIMKLCSSLSSVFWHCWLGGRKGVQPIKIWEDGECGHWLVRMEWRPAGWSVCLPLLISPCTINSRSSLLAPAYLGGPGKRDVKRLWRGGGNSAADFKSFIVEIVPKTTNLGIWSPFWGS